MTTVLKGPSDKQLEIIKESLKEDSDRFSHNLQLFEQWVDCQPHLPKNYDKRILAAFLRGCKHDMPTAQRKIQVHFTIKQSFPELFAEDPNAKEILHATKVANVAALPTLTPDGSRVTVFRLADPDPKKFDMESSILFTVMMFDIRLYEDHPYYSDVLVFDGKNFSALHAAKFISMLFKKMITVGRIAYPIRIGRIHVVNAPTMVEKIVAVVKPYMHQKIRDRFIVHKEPSDLFKYVSQDILPAELGGKCGKLQDLTDRWYKCLVDHAEWWENQKNVKCSGPIPKSIYQTCGLEDSIGVSGSFRKLAID